MKNNIKKWNIQCSARDVEKEIVYFPSPSDLSREKKLDLFIKKVKKQDKSIKLQDIGHTHGLLRCLAPQAIEWVNSVYSYNSNYNKNLIVADDNLMTLVRSFLNLKYKRNQKKRKVLKAIKYGVPYAKYRAKKRPLPGLKKRLTVNKVFVGKGGVKHTGTNALITLFLWKKSHDVTFLIYLKRLIKITFKKILSGNRLVYSSRNTYNDIAEREFSYKHRKSHRRANHLYYSKANLLHSLLERQILNNDEIYLYYLSSLVESSSIESNVKPNIKINKGLHPLTFYENRGSIRAITSWKASLHRKYTFKLNRFFRLFVLNEIKFNKSFLENLRKVASVIYDKNVIFNFVSLKKETSNSDILSQIVALKLKRREIGVGTVLGSAIQDIRLPRLPSKVKLKVLKTRLRLNILAGRSLFNLLSGKIKTKGKSLWFEFLLFKYDRVVNPVSMFGRLMVSHRKAQNLRSKSGNSKKRTVKLFKKLFKTFFFKAKFIKDRILAGIWLEASGRLTKRFKAARAVYRIKWVGGLRNLDCSFQSKPTVVLRGWALPNVESSFVPSKRRIGAFGLKVSVASRDVPKAYSPFANDIN